MSGFREFVNFDPVKSKAEFCVCQTGSSRVVYVGQLPNLKYSDEDVLKLAEPFGCVRKYSLHRRRREVQNQNRVGQTDTDWSSLKVNLCPRSASSRWSDRRMLKKWPKRVKSRR